MEIKKEIKKEDFWKEILDIHPNLIEHNADNLRKLSKVISSVVIQMLPDRLYQYRSFNTENDTYESCSHNVTNLINDEIWGTKISKENDQYEIFPYFGKNEMKELLQEGIKLQDDFASITEDEARKAFPIIGKVIGDEGYDLFVKFCRNINVQSVLDSFIECIILGTETLNENFILDGVKARLDGTYLACFTENDFSTLMEAHYSKGSTGFVIEYDSNDLIQKCDKIDGCEMEMGCRTGGLSIPVYPVNYSNERIDLSRIIAVCLFYYYLSLSTGSNKVLGWEYLDCLADLKIICWKKKDWEIEKEWRMISFNRPGDNEGPDHIFLKKVKALSVSIFESTSPHNRELMKDICRQKGIPLYLLKEDISSKICNIFIRERIV